MTPTLPAISPAMNTFAKSLPAYQHCMRRWPRVTAALMRHCYLTESEAAIVLRDWIRNREGYHTTPSTYWTELTRENLSAIIRSMRSHPSPVLAFNLLSVRRYLAI